MAIAVSPGPARGQVHGHLNAGAYGTSQGDQLYFVNGPDFVESSGYVKTLTYTGAGRFAGYFQGNITLTALARTPEHGGPEPNAPALGSFLQYTIALLEGPPGGQFGFWENLSTNPTLSLLPGESPTNLVRLTEADGSPGSDPYGHIHGRRFTATKSGIYKVAFRVYDTSTNGVGGGPIHTPSDSLAVYFQAGINIASMSQTGGVATVRYGSITNAAFTLEYTTNVTDGIWLPAAGPQFGNELFQELQDTSATNGMRFYRIVSEPVEP
jgi:hypothetical protein